MNPNVWNIKEILNIPSVSGWTGSAGDGSSLTDSQYLYSSQLCPDPSQSFSQDISGPSRISLHGSQEVRESSISTTYHNKPYLFAGDSQDNGKVLTLASSKNKGILERFEEDKRKSKEKEESEMLRGRVLQLGNCMENIKIALDSIEGTVESAKNAVMQYLEAFAKTMQDSMASMRDNMTLQLEALLHKLDCEAETLREMKGKDTKMHLDLTALQSCVQGLNQDLQALRTDHSKEQGLLGDVLSLLRGLVSSQRLTATMADRTVQTSPCLLETFHSAGEEPKHLESLKMYNRPVAVCKGKGRDCEQPDDVEGSVGPCSLNMLRVGGGQDSTKRSYRTRSAVKGGSAYVNRPAHTLHENIVPNGSELAKCHQGPNSQSRRETQQTACTTGQSLKNSSTSRPTSRKRPRAGSAKNSKAQTLKKDWLKPPVKSRAEDRALQDSILQDLNGYVKATPTFNTYSVHQQRKSWWQLFNITDDSE
ncbi:hypothetical protein GN956_G16321 [Arapaima gigas]